MPSQKLITYDLYEFLAFHISEILVTRRLLPMPISENEIPKILPPSFREEVEVQQ